MIDDWRSTVNKRCIESIVNHLFDHDASFVTFVFSDTISHWLHKANQLFIMLNGLSPSPSPRSFRWIFRMWKYVRILFVSNGTDAASVEYFLHDKGFAYKNSLFNQEIIESTPGWSQSLVALQNSMLRMYYGFNAFRISNYFHGIMLIEWQNNTIWTRDCSTGIDCCNIFVGFCFCKSSNPHNWHTFSR